MKKNFIEFLLFAFWYTRRRQSGKRLEKDEKLRNEENTAKKAANNKE